MAIPERQLAKVYGSDSIRLPLLERITIPETRSGSKFSNAARQLQNGRLKPKNKRQPSSQDDPQYDVPPLKPELWKIQLAHDFPQLDKVGVLVSGIGDRSQSELTNGDLELTLNLAAADPASGMLRAQARKCAEHLGRISRDLAYPSSPQSLGIPFALISEGTDFKQIGHFVERLEDFLPMRLSVGEPRITSQITS